MNVHHYVDHLRTAIDVNIAARAAADANAGARFTKLLEIIYRCDLVAVRDPQQARLIWESLRADEKVFNTFIDIVSSFTLNLLLDKEDYSAEFFNRVGKLMKCLAPDPKNTSVDPAFTASMQAGDLGWVDDHPWFAMLVLWRYAIPMQSFQVKGGE